MELSSETDSDDCQLYSKAAENVAKRRKINQEKLCKYKDALNMSNFVDLDNDSLSNELDKANLPDFVASDVSSSITNESSSDSEDTLPLTELLKRYQSERARKRPKTTLPKENLRKNQQTSRPRPRPRQSSRRRTTNSSRPIIDTIVLDDDTGYQMSNLPPINFNSHSTRKCSKKPVNLSICSLLSHDSEEDESDNSSNTVTLTVEWRGIEKPSRKTYELRRFQKFDTIFEDIARVENVTTSRILLMHKLNSVKPSDTPSSLNFKYYGALTGYVSKSEINHQENAMVPFEGNNDDSNEILVVKLQQENNTFTLSIGKHQKMSVLYEKCSEELKCGQNKLKLSLDGETVDPKDSVTDLDLEGGEIFHVYIKK